MSRNVRDLMEGAKKCRTLKLSTNLLLWKPRGGISVGRGVDLECGLREDLQEELRNL